MMTNAAPASRTTAQLLQLNAIEVNANAVLAITPMNTDQRVVHYAARALVARVECIVDAL